VFAQVFETGAHKIHYLKIVDVTARVFGDAAVVTGRTHGVGEFEGARYDVVIRFTDTFVRLDGRGRPLPLMPAWRRRSCNVGNKTSPARVRSGYDD
jgi:hypothetical protein